LGTIIAIDDEGLQVLLPTSTEVAASIGEDDVEVGVPIEIGQANVVAIASFCSAWPAGLR
jgi:hypothetical protein